MNKRHKHYETIVAWASGKEIQFRAKPSDVWNDYLNISYTPSFMEVLEWRIKPEPKPDVVREYHLSVSPSDYNLTPNLRLTFDGETGKLKKAEVIS